MVSPTSVAAPCKLEDTAMAMSTGTGEMRKRYGFIHVDKYDDGTGTYERRRKDSFYAYQKIIKSNGAEGLD